MHPEQQELSDLSAADPIAELFQGEEGCTPPRLGNPSFHSGVGKEGTMRGIDHQQSDMFSYLSPEQRVRKDHPCGRCGL